MLLFYILSLFTLTKTVIAQSLDANATTYIAHVQENYQGPGECLDFGYDTILCIISSDNISDALSTNEVMEFWPDGYLETQICQQNAPWHLNAVTQFVFPTRDTYAYDIPQSFTTVYVLDSWMQIEHPEFEGRAFRGAAFEYGESQDHATHVGGIIGSKTYGINKRARIVSVQVLNGQGRGSWSNIIRGLNWVSQQKAVTVVNMSIGGGRSDAVNMAVNAMAKRGWIMVSAAGNEASDACNSSPAGASEGITVGAYDNMGKFSSFSNYGKCVDILAPGSVILSLCSGNRICYMSGTSMATPVVAGVASLFPSLDRFQLVKLARFGIKNIPDYTTSKSIVFNQNSRCFDNEDELEILDDKDEKDENELKFIDQTHLI